MKLCLVCVFTLLRNLTSFTFWTSFPFLEWMKLHISNLINTLIMTVTSHTHTHTHTHTRLTVLFPGLPGWTGTRKVKPIWILLKQETESGSGISWAYAICTSLQTDNHASTSPLSFLQAGCPSCRPTNSVRAPKARLLAN